MESIKKMFSFLVVIGVVAIGIVCCVSAEDLVLVNDTFDTGYKNGPIVGQNKWFLDAPNESSDNLIIEDSSDDKGGKVLYAPNSGGIFYLTKNLSRTQTNGTLYASFRFKTEDDGGNVNYAGIHFKMFSKDYAGKDNLNPITVAGNRDITMDFGQGAEKLASYESGKWYRLTAEINLDTNKMNVYLDNTKIADQVQASVPGTSAGFQLVKMQILFNNYRPTAYIDDVYLGNVNPLLHKIGNVTTTTGIQTGKVVTREDKSVSSTSKMKNTNVIALYMTQFLKDGPAYRTQVDRIQMDFADNMRENYKREMLLAKDCGIDAFAYNAIVIEKDKGIEEFKMMADIAQSINFKVFPFPGVVLTQSSKLEGVALERAWLIIKDFVNTFVNHPGVFRINGKMAILIDGADYCPLSAWEKIFDKLKTECKENMDKVCFVAQLRDINVDIETLEKYLKLGFSGFLDLYGSSSAQRLRDAVDEVIPDGKGIVMVSMTHGFYWRIEYGAGTTSDTDTSPLRNNWGSVKKLPINVVNLMSWNDLCENHHFIPSQYLGHIRGEINKHYVALMRGTTPPAYNDYHLYYTFQRSLLFGQILNIELLNLPNTKGDYFASCEVRTTSGELLKEFDSTSINASSLEVVKLSVPTASFPSNTRTVDIWGVIKDKEKKTILKKKVGFVILEPIINRSFLVLSRLITDIPDVDIQIKQNKDTIELTAESKLSLRDLHLQRSDFIPVRYYPTKRIPVKVLFAAYSRKYDEKGQDIMIKHQGSVSIIGGEILNSMAYSPGTMNETKIVQKSKSELIFESRTDGIHYPEGLILELSDNKNMKLDVSIDHCRFSISLDELKTNSVGYSFSENKLSISVSLTDEDPLLFKPRANESLIYNIKEMTPSSSLIWWHTPVEVLFGRAMDNDRKWVDSSPIAVNYGGSRQLVKGYAFDYESNSRFPVTFFENERLIANWDFAKTSKNGVVLSESMYDFPSCLGGSGDLRVPFVRFLNNNVNNPALVQDSGRQVAEFNGQQNFVYGPVSIFPTGAFHLTMLIKPGTTDILQSIFSDKRFNGSAGIVALYILPGGIVQGQVSTASNQWVNIESEKTLNVGQWYKIEIVCDLNELRLFIDDKLERKVDFQLNELRPSAHPVIGAEEKFSDDFHKYFKGSIAYVKIEAYTETQ